MEGLRIVNGQQAYTVQLGSAETVEDLLNAINGSGAEVLAEIDAAGVITGSWSESGYGIRGWVTGTATALRLGNTVASYEIVITDDADRRVCTARVTCQLVRPRAKS